MVQSMSLSEEGHPASAPRVCGAENSPVSGSLPRPEKLGQDFSLDRAQTRRIVGTLYGVLLDQAATPTLQSTYERWSRFFVVATEYEQKKTALEKNARLQKTLRAFGAPAGRPDFARFIFATQTF